MALANQLLVLALYVAWLISFRPSINGLLFMFPLALTFLVLKRFFYSKYHRNSFLAQQKVEEEKTTLKEYFEKFDPNPLFFLKIEPAPKNILDAEQNPSENGSLFPRLRLSAINYSAIRLSSMMLPYLKHSLPFPQYPLFIERKVSGERYEDDKRIEALEIQRLERDSSSKAICSPKPLDSQFTEKNNSEGDIPSEKDRLSRIPSDQRIIMKDTPT